MSLPSMVGTCGPSASENPAPGASIAAGVPVGVVGGVPGVTGIVVPELHWVSGSDIMGTPLRETWMARDAVAACPFCPSSWPRTRDDCTGTTSPGSTR